MEYTVFPREKDIRERLERLVELRLHTDDKKIGDEFKALQRELTKGVGLPTYVLVDPRDPKTVIAQFDGADPPSGRRFARWLAQHVPADAS